MRTNNILTKMRAGELAYGCALKFPSTTLAELVGMAGMDFLYLDGEHGPFTLETIEDMCRVAELYNMTTVARIPDISSPTVLDHLDRGILGLEGPHITTGDDARQFVNASYYAPKGNRSVSASRGVYYGKEGTATEYMAQVNSQIYLFGLLEDIKVLDHIDDILTVEDIYSYHIGTNDLAQTMDLPGQPKHPEVLEVAEKLITKIHAAGRKLTHEVMAVARGDDIFFEGVKAFREQRNS